MLRKSGFAGLCALALYGCTPGKPTEGAVLVVVTLEPGARASCLVVEAGEPGGPALKDVRIEASQGQREYKIAVARGDLPAEVGLRARTSWGVGCTEPLAAIGASEEKRSGFPVGTVSTVALSIFAPPAADDADADGFVPLTRGGLDCNDDDPAMNPAAAEVCSDLRDLNCNGLAGCADPVCQAQSCALPGTVLAFVNPPQTLLAGQCSAEVALEVRNATSLASPVAADTPVALTAAPAPGFGFFSDPSCLVPADTVTVVARTTRATLYLRGEAAGEVVVTASAAGLSPAVQTETITAGVAVKLGFVSPPRTVAAGGCSSALTVETQDAFGNGTPVSSPAPLTLTALPAAGVAFFRQPDCTVAVTGLGVAAGARRATYYFSSSSAGTVTMGAASAPLLAASQDQTVTAGAPSVLAFTNPPRTAVAGGCSGQLTVQVRDGFTNPAPVATATSLSLTGTPSGSFTFFTDAACAAPAVTSVGLAAGESAASFYFRGQEAVAGSVEVSAGGFTPVPQPATITPGPASALGFVTTAQGVQAGACSGIVTLRSQDGFGNAANVTGSTQVNLTVSPSAGFAFYSDNGCGTEVTSVNLLPASPNASFYFQGSAPVPHTITAQATGLGSATQIESLGVGAPAKLVFLTPAQTLSAGQCSGLVVVQTQDVVGNPSNVTANKTVNLTASPPTGFLFYSDPTCTAPITTRVISSGGASQSFYFRGTRAGPVSVTAAIGGLTSAIQGETVNVAPPNAMVFTSAEQFPVAGACSALVTLEVQDAFANVAPVAGGATVGLTAAPATGFLFYSDDTCATAVTTTSIAPNGSTAGFYFKGTTTGAVVMTAAALGLGTVDQTATLSPAAASRLIFMSAAQTLTAGDCSGPVSVRALDQYGNPSPVSAATTVTFSAPPLGGVSFYNNAGCTTLDNTVGIGNGSTTSAPPMYFKGTIAGSVVVTAAGGTLTSATQTEVIEPDVPAALAFTTPPQTLNAGDCSAVATVEAQDSLGNPSPVALGSTVTLAALAAGFGFYSNAGCTTAVVSVPILPGGTSASFYFRGTLPGAVNVSANAAGVGIDTQVETIEVGPPVRVVFLNSPLRQTIGLCSSALSLETRDAVGNASPVTAATVLDLSAAQPRVSFFSDATCTTATGTVSLALGASTGDFWFQGTAVGGTTINVSDPTAGLLPAAQAATVTGVPATLVITSPAQTLRAGQCSAEVTVEARDAAGLATNVLTAEAVALTGSTGITFYSDDQCTALVLAASIAQGASSTGFWFKGITGGAGSVTATASFGSDVQGAIFFPAVQTGSCTIAAAADTSANCTIPSPLSSLSTSFLVFQARTAPGDTAPDRTHVRCRFGSTSTIVCSRGAAAGGVVNIEWQTADLPQATVQHLPTVATLGTTTDVPVTTVPLGTTFVLHSMESTNTAADGCDFFTARLANDTTAELRTSGAACNTVATHALQVVTIPGVSVSRGTAGGLTTNVMSVTDTPSGGEGGAVTAANTALLYSWRMVPTASTELCRRMLRGRVATDTTLVFSRSDGTTCNGDAIDEVRWERLEFPYPLQQITTAMPNGTATAAAVLSSVDTTRTVVFAGGQIASGQAAGEGSLAGSMTFGAMFASYRVTSPTTLAVARDVTLGQARWTSFVVQLTP